MEDDAKAERKKLFDSYRDVVMAREQANSEHFDKAILTYSAAGLALSLSFLKDFGPLHEIWYGFLLKGSWAFFVLAIIFTIMSFPVSQAGLRKQLVLAERYYIDNDTDAFTAKNPWKKAVEQIGTAAGLFFITAVILTTVFVSINMGDLKMVNDQGGKQAPITTKGTGQDAASIPNMQEMRNAATVPSMTRAASIPSMQAVPKTESPIAAPVSTQATPATPPAAAAPAKSE